IAGSDNRTIPTVPVDAPRGLRPQGAGNQPHDSPGPSAVRVDAHRSANGSQSILISQEPTSGTNGSASASSGPGPTRRGRGGRNQHKCSICGKVYEKPYRLSDHMRQHTGSDKGYPCDISGCNKAYTNQAGLRRHQKNAHGRGNGH
ncbi:unnamed protein product, partial [Rhizoctonia solani]